jgi:hypothetical protein
MPLVDLIRQISEAVGAGLANAAGEKKRLVASKVLVGEQLRARNWAFPLFSSGPET